MYDSSYERSRATDEGHIKHLRVLSKLYGFLQKDFDRILTGEGIQSQIFKKIFDQFQQKSFQMKNYHFSFLFQGKHRFVFFKILSFLQEIVFLRLFFSGNIYVPF